MSKREFIKYLKDLIKILKEEKEALVKNDGDTLVEILNKKSIHIEELEKFKGIDFEDEKIMGLIGEIDSLQELNLLLTKQALSFQEDFLESLSKATKTTKTNTYQKIGKYEKNSGTSIIEKDV